MALTKVSNSMLVQPVNHNILINPSFTVKQRGDVVDHGNISYGPDRWKVRGKDTVGGTELKSSTEVDSATGINKLVVKHPRDATDPIKGSAYTFQRVEAVNLQGMYGKEMTFSFGHSDVGGSGIPKVEIRSFDSSAASKDLYYATPTSLGDNRWACTVTLSTTDGTIPDPSEHGMQVTIFPNEGNNAPDEWSVWETKLEVGSVATPFIARQYGEELALCQRYYYEGYLAEWSPVAPWSNLYVCRVSFPVPLRGPPTYTAISSSILYSNVSQNVSTITNLQWREDGTGTRVFFQLGPNWTGTPPSPVSASGILACTFMAKVDAEL